MIQMLANLVVIGVGVRVFVSAVHEARSRASPHPIPESRSSRARTGQTTSSVQGSRPDSNRLTEA